ncbi:shwachman-Bodian-diamond syndrome protein-like protein [Eremomyces bilateralis CBS 781.70]|uniref:Ribosome maturation protein SDO1 n=1 Tax=Eremomyces bilateralis CBS 781.70 TaxID=1392243 RepID=A0A6G1G0V9_9PEZI|nr:shwachman-Bodian-diamond syndrome protein-like protein [Eremomyces bilateralis CBS 781.70]KAF1811745.1 shwachman-Bodian-diamond syndrome protein-like protein [Eremomyces bilateralis CBS 781.70]
MPVGIIQPSNFIKLTNVSLVRMRRGKKRFEIACYKNKVLEWRSGVEKDLDNVLQIHNVFLNVSKGQVASSDDLKKAFGAKKLDDIILEVLSKGELQVGEKERNAQLDRIRHEVLDIVAGKLVDPKTKRVYTTGMIEKALDQLSSQSSHSAHPPKSAPTSGEAATSEPAGTAAAGVKEKDLPVWTGVVTTKSSKSQALDAMKALIAHQPIPLARARMKLRITCPTGILKQAFKAPKPADGDGEGAEKASGTVKERILGLIEQVESQDVVGDDWEVVGFVEPGAYRTLTDFIGSHTKGKARAEVLDMAVIHDGD